MPIYEIHFRDSEGEIHETEEFDARDDVDAMAQAHVLYEKTGKYGFVLMRDTRIILQNHPRASETHTNHH
jgi:hypothetical protein